MFAQVPLKNKHETASIHILSISCVGWDSTLTVSACDGGDYDSGGGTVGRDLSKPVEMGKRTEREIILEEPFVVGPGEGARLCLLDKSKPDNSCMVGMNNGSADFSDEHLLVESGRISKVRITVRRQPIFSTVPSISRSGLRIQSPNANGRSR